MIVARGNGKHRLWGNMKVSEIGAGTSEIRRRLIGRGIFRATV